MNWSFDELLRDAPVRLGNGGRLLASSGALKAKPQALISPIDKTTAAAKLIAETEAEERSAKTARLKAARLARDDLKAE
jgi:hypothetical protein